MVWRMGVPVSVFDLIAPETLRLTMHAHGHLPTTTTTHMHARTGGKELFQIRESESHATFLADGSSATSADMPSSGPSQFDGTRSNSRVSDDPTWQQQSQQRLDGAEWDKDGVVMLRPRLNESGPQAYITGALLVRRSSEGAGGRPAGVGAEGPRVSEGGLQGSTRLSLTSSGAEVVDVIAQGSPKSGAVGDMPAEEGLHPAVSIDVRAHKDGPDAV
jgi:hypothetical protein